MNDFNPEESKVVALRECPAAAMLTRSEPRPPIRKLKIEEDGDPWNGRIKPKIRLMGRWLERAGFSPGSHVHVTCVAPGVIELRSRDDLTGNGTKQPAREQPDYPF